MRTSLKNIIYNGMSVNAMFSFAGGQILIAYALLLGAGPIAIGILGSLEFISNFIYLISAYIIKKGKSVKQISIFYSTISRPFYLLLAILAFFQDNHLSLYILMICAFSAYGLSAVTGGVFYPWMKKLIPQKIMDSFFAERYRWMMIANMLTMFVSSCCMFIFEKYFPQKMIFSYFILMILAFIFGVISVLTLFKVKDAKLEIDNQTTFFKDIIAAFKRGNFSTFYIFMGTINFATSYVTPFFTIFMLEENKIGMSLIIGLTIISQITYIFSAKIWAKLAQSKGCFPVLEIGCLIYICSIFIFIFSLNLNATYMLSALFLNHILLGFAMFAIKLGTNNLPLQIVPQENSFIYLTIISIFRGCGSLIAGVTAGAILLYLRGSIDNQFILWSVFWSFGVFSFVISILISKYIRKIHHTATK